METKWPSNAQPEVHQLVSLSVLILNNVMDIYRDKVTKKHSLTQPDIYRFVSVFHTEWLLIQCSILAQC